MKTTTFYRKTLLATLACSSIALAGTLQAEVATSGSLAGAAPEQVSMPATPATKAVVAEKVAMPQTTQAKEPAVADQKSTPAAEANVKKAVPTPASEKTDKAEVKSSAYFGDITEDSIKIFVNRVVQPYEIIKSVRTEVFLTDAKSEEDAELQAFKKMLVLAKQAGADGVMEVRRVIVQDSIEQRVTTTTPAGGSGIFRDDIDSTSVTLDEMTLSDYWRGKGTLNSKRFDTVFDRTKLSQRSVVFKAKAIKLTTVENQQ